MEKEEKEEEDVGKLTYKRWRTDLERRRMDFIRWRTGRWRINTLPKRPVTKTVTLREFQVIYLKILFH